MSHIVTRDNPFSLVEGPSDTRHEDITFFQMLIDVFHRITHGNQLGKNHILGRNKDRLGYINCNTL